MTAQIPIHTLINNIFVTQQRIPSSELGVPVEK